MTSKSLLERCCAYALVLLLTFSVPILPAAADDSGGVTEAEGNGASDAQTTPPTDPVRDTVADGAPAPRYVVGLHGGPRDRTTDLPIGGRFHDAPIVDRIPALDALVVQVDAAQAVLFEAQARLDPRVRYVEPDPERRLIEHTPDDPLWSESGMYGARQIRADQAWDRWTGGPSATVCVVDTGVRYTHEDLAGARWLGGYDVRRDVADPWDDNGHGTHVAGTAVATIDNAAGIVGIAQVGLYGVKVLSASGRGTFADVAAGIIWCADNAGDRTVINLSLGCRGGIGSLCDQEVMRDAVAYAEAAGALVVSSAGNSGPCGYCVGIPAAYPETIAVTCTNVDEALCSFSSEGPEAEVAAPGRYILSSCYNNDTHYCSLSGTSMSAPHVSGAAALAWSGATCRTRDEVRQALADTARDLGPNGRDNRFGHGVIDAQALLDGLACGPVFLDAHAGPGVGDISLGWYLTHLAGDPGVTGFRIDRNASADGNLTPIATLGPNATTYRDSGLENGTTWHYRVTVLDGAGDSLKSEIVAATVFDIPLAPHDPTASRGRERGEVTLRWAPPLDDGGTAVTEYRVYRLNETGNRTFISNTTQTVYRDGGHPDNTTFTYHLSAVNLVGEGPLTSAVNGSTPSLPVTPPGDLTVARGPDRGGLTLDWGLPADDGGTDILHYKVYRTGPDGQETDLGIVGATGLHDTGHPDNTTFVYEVSAVNAVGEGPRTLPVAGRTFDLPGAPVALSAQTGPGAGEIQVSWDRPLDHGGTPPTVYHLHRTREGAAGETVLSVPAATGRAVAAADVYTCLLSDGNVRCWGENPTGDPEPYTAGDATALAAGRFHTCVLQEAGNVACWGSNIFGEADPYLGGDAVEIDASTFLTCILRSNGNVLCSGRTSYGEADGYSGGDAVSVAVGQNHGCALRSNGNVKCWGSNSYSQSSSYTKGDAVALTAGDYHTCVLRSNGDIYCWGAYEHGQRVRYEGGDATAITAGREHTCALLVGDDVRCWGDDLYGQSQPYLGGNATSIEAGWYHTCALLTSGAVECWGYNGDRQAEPYLDGDARDHDSGELHNCVVTGSSDVWCWGNNDEGQAKAYNGGDAVDVTTGWYHTCALLTSGDVHCWGRMREAYKGGDVKELDTGMFHTCALLATGNVSCWGSGGDGQTGSYKGGDGVGVATGARHSCVLRSNGNIQCWGRGASGETQPYEGGDAIGVAAGYAHTCALRQDGTVGCWGSNNYGQSAAYNGGDAVAVNTGPWHTCVIVADGGAHCWGRDDKGQSAPYLGDDAVAISAGRFHTCVRTVAANVTCWGYSGPGQAADLEASSFSFIDSGLLAGTNYTYALTATNMVGEGPRSLTATARTFAPPGPPRDLVATRSDTPGAIELTWAPPLEDGGASIAGYRIHRGASSDATSFVKEVGNVTAYTDSGLSDGTTFHYRVRAVTAAGEGSLSAASAATTLAVPEAPQALNATAGPAAGEITLTWDAPLEDGGTSVTHHRIYRGSENEAPSFLVEVGNVSNYTDTGLPNGATFHYVVRAVNEVGEGAASDAAAATTFVVPPGAPQDLQATAGPDAGQITLHWAPPADDGGATITNHHIYRGTTSGETTFLAEIGALTTFADSDLRNDTTYHYTVRAVTSAGPGPDSDEAAATTFARPGAPRNLTATPGPGAGEVHLEWDPPLEDGGTDISGYRIHRSDDGTSWTEIAEVSATTYTDNGLPPGVTVHYEVEAVNVVGTGSRTGPATAETFPTPTAPTGLVAATGDAPGAIQLTWGPPSDDGGLTVTGYRIYRGETPEDLSFLAEVGDVDAFQDTELPDNATRHYRVAAVTDAGEGTRSELATATTPATPSAPLGPVATAGPGPGTIHLEWEPPADDGGLTIIAYRVYRGNTSTDDTFLAEVNGTAYTDPGLPNDATRHYRVTAVNDVGEGVASTRVAATTFTVPAAPLDLLAASGPGDDNTTLEWQAPPDDGGLTVTGYRLYRSDQDAPFVLIADLDVQFSYRDTGLAPNVTYQYRVAAVNDAGEGPASEAAAVTTPALVPGAPSGVQAAPGSDNVTLTWVAPGTDGGAAIVGYRIYAGNSSDELTLLAEVGNVLTYRETGLSPETTRHYRVSAVNGVGEGSWSDPVSATTLTLPSAPQQFRADPGSFVGQVHLSWVPPQDDGGAPILGYRIERSESSDGPYRPIITVDGETHSHTDFGRPLRTFHYRVTAINQLGEGPYAHACGKPNPWVPGFGGHIVCGLPSV